MTGVLKVLIADDHACHRLLLRTVFESFGCSVTTVENGAEAVAEPGEFDLICLDRHMPVMSGDAAAAILGGRAFLVACTSDDQGAPPVYDMVMAKPVTCVAVFGVVEAARAARRDVLDSRSALHMSRLLSAALQAEPHASRRFLRAALRRLPAIPVQQVVGA